MGAAGERPDIDIKPLLRSALLKFYPQGDTSARQRRFESRFFPPLGELTKAIKLLLPVCQLQRWQLGLNKWSSPTTKSLVPS